VPKATFTPRKIGGSDPGRALMERRDVWLPETNGFTSSPVYDRDLLDAGNEFRGPAIVEQMDATTFVPAGMIARVDAWLNLMLEAE
jgi:N-methylhydantoinase A